MTLSPGVEEAVRLVAGEVVLEGHLQIPPAARGLVIVAMGARYGRRVQEIGRILRESALGTLTTDLLTADEELQYGRRFDIPFLADRFLQLSLDLRPSLAQAQLRLGILSASTGASGALWAAVFPEMEVAGIVSCEGRLDLVEDLLPEVQVPTLLVAGSRGGEATRMNAQLYRKIPAPKDMIVVPGATSVYEESLPRLELARWASQWFNCFLPAVDPG
jgi:hypothetical protein